MSILCPAASCDSPSMSTSLNASSSANSMKTGSTLFIGVGVNLSTDGTLPKVTGLGNRPLLPHLCLRRRISSHYPAQFFPYTRSLDMLMGCLLLQEPTPTLFLTLFSRCFSFHCMVPLSIALSRELLAFFGFLPLISLGSHSTRAYSGTLIYFCALSHN